MRKLLVVTSAVLGLLVSGVGIAETGMSIADHGTIVTTARSIAYVTVTVTCPPLGDSNSSEGTTTLALSQQTRTGTVTGSGSTTVTCDNAPHTYSVAVTASSGSFSRGLASVSGSTSFPYEMCIENSDGTRECTTFMMTMVVEDQPLDLSYIGPSRT